MIKSRAIRAGSREEIPSITHKLTDLLEYEIWSIEMFEHLAHDDIVKLFKVRREIVHIIYDKGAIISRHKMINMFLGYANGYRTNVHRSHARFREATQ